MLWVLLVWWFLRACEVLRIALLRTEPLYGTPVRNLGCSRAATRNWHS